MGKLINIDNGGTLTDFCLLDGERLIFTKTLTTPHDLSTCLFEGLGRLSKLSYGEEDISRLLQSTDYIRYSTTQGTNALVQRRGPRLGLISSRESAIDTLKVGSNRAGLFDALIGERVRYVDTGQPDDALDLQLTQSVNELSASGANRIIVSLDAPDASTLERRFERIILRRYPSHLLGALPIGFAAAMSQDPDYARRTWTAIFNGFLHPAMEQFLYSAEHRLKSHRTRNPLLIFRNDGGSARVAKTIALKTYSSGPRGGMEGAKALARHYGFAQLLSIDVGGTTTDVGVVEAGEVQQDHYGEVEGVPVSVPLCKIHSEGVGGSSVIEVADGVIKVGPTSVGAAPGPACFARGGTELTLTDIALINGMIDPSTYFGGELPLDIERAKTALSRAVGEPLKLAQVEAVEAAENAWIDQVVIGIQRITEKSDETMLAGFGGGGPMLLTAVADRLGAAKAIIPGMAPVFSAYGIGFSDLSQHYQVHLEDGSPQGLGSASKELLLRASRDMFAENTKIDDCELQWSLVNSSAGGEVVSWVEGQGIPEKFSFPLLLRLEAIKEIERLHFKPTEIENEHHAKTDATRALVFKGEHLTVPLYRFPDLKVGATALGPCIVEDDYFTARIDAGWHFSMTSNRDLLLTKQS